MHFFFFVSWDASKLTYTDGTNSVKVSGVTADQVTLKFGDDGSDEYKALASAGAFFDCRTQLRLFIAGERVLGLQSVYDKKLRKNFSRLPYEARFSA